MSTSWEILQTQGNILALIHLRVLLLNKYEILRGYYMTFSILALVSARYSHIETDSEAEELIWVED
jgi:hypothetical protein